MKIRIKEKGKTQTISLPNFLVLSKLVQGGTIEFGGKGVRLTGLDRKRGEKLLSEMKRIRKEKGEWVLVEVQSADGTEVTIFL